MTKEFFKQKYRSYFKIGSGGASEQSFEEFIRDCDAVMLQPSEPGERPDPHTWQTCCKCGGSGIAMNHNNPIPTYNDQCDVCLGKKIISTVTGLPPSDEFQKVHSFVDHTPRPEYMERPDNDALGKSIDVVGSAVADKTFSYYRCPDCGWVAGVGSSSCVDECERCNPKAKDDLDVLIADAVNSLLEQFFAKDGWLKPLNRQIYYRVGHNHFRFDFSYVYDEKRFTVPPRQNVNPMVDHMAGMDTEKINPVKTGEYINAPNESYGYRRGASQGQVFTIEEVERAINYATDNYQNTSTASNKSHAEIVLMLIKNKLGV